MPQQAQEYFLHEILAELRPAGHPPAKAIEAAVMPVKQERGERHFARAHAVHDLLVAPTNAGGLVQGRSTC